MKKTLVMTAVLAALTIGAPLASYATDLSVTSDVSATTDAVSEVEVTEATLADGTTVHIKGDAVFVVDAEGNETAAPDGDHTLEDGSVITTKDGHVVEADAEADADAEVEVETEVEVTE